MLAERGAEVLDADAFAREVLDDPAVIEVLASSLGADLLHAGKVDRSRLGARVFRDVDARATLEATVHPRVRERFKRAAEAAMARVVPPEIIVHDVPLLFETGLAPTMDVVLVVDAPLPLRIARVQARTGLDDEEVRRRDAVQWPAERKRASADILIDNSGGLAALEARVEGVWKDLLERARAEHGSLRPEAADARGDRGDRGDR